MRMTVSGDQGSLYNRLCTIAIVSCLQNEGFGFDPGEKCKAMWKEHGPPSGIGDARALGRGMTILAVHAARAAHRRDEHTLFLGGLCPPKPSHPSLALPRWGREPGSFPRLGEAGRGAERCERFSRQAPCAGRTTPDENGPVARAACPRRRDEGVPPSLPGAGTRGNPIAPGSPHSA